MTLVGFEKDCKNPRSSRPEIVFISFHAGASQQPPLPRFRVAATGNCPLPALECCGRRPPAGRNSGRRESSSIAHRTCPQQAASSDAAVRSRPPQSAGCGCGRLQAAAAAAVGSRRRQPSTAELRLPAAAPSTLRRPQPWPVMNFFFPPNISFSPTLVTCFPISMFRV